MSLTAVACMASYFAARTSDTIAHKSWPMGTVARVTHLGTGHSVTGVIRDRGPFIAGRCVDLSVPLAGALGIRGSGVARVQVEVVSWGSGAVGRRVRARLGRHGRVYQQPAPAAVPVLPNIFGAFFQ